MKDEEFRIYCVQKGIETITEDLQDVFTFLWNEKFPGTPFTSTDLKQKISSPLLKKMPKQHEHNNNIKEWDIIMLAYVMVDADVLELRSKDFSFAVAISGIKQHRNDIYHRVHFACDKKEFEIYFGSLEKLAKFLDSDKYKKSSQNKKIVKEIEKFHHLKLTFGEEKKTKKEYKQMEFDIKLYQIREQYTEEKSKLEYQLFDLHEKLGKQMAEKSEIQRELQKISRETQKLKDESKENISLQKKIDFNQKKTKNLQQKLHQKRTEIFRENVKKRALIRRLKTRNDENQVLRQQQIMLIENYTSLMELTDVKTKENKELHVQIQSKTEEAIALQTEKKQHLREIKEMTIEGKHAKKQLQEKDMYEMVISFAFLLFLVLIWVNKSYSTLTSTVKTEIQNRTIQELTKTIHEQEKKLKDQYTRIYQLENKVSKTMKEKSEQNMTVIELTDKINEQTRELEDQNKRLNHIIQEQSLQIENQNRTIQEHSETIHEQEKKLEVQYKRNDQLEEEMSETMEEKSEQNKTIKELKNKISAQARDLEDQSKRKNAVIQEQSLQIENQKKTIQEQSETINEQEKKLKDLGTNIDQLNGELSEIKKEKSEQNKTIKELRNKISAQARDLEDQSKRKNAVIQEQSLQIENQKKTIQEQSETINEQEKKLKDLGTKIDQLNGELSEIKKEKSEQNKTPLLHRYAFYHLCPFPNRYSFWRLQV
ncbi:putative leucine-rich repeat-containing protein DDB_G0290503 [Mercenaria mercenaria]|uniref:putative leucine-rich repeat-containing protein DDB_G0290503 n=1 Tax=Mercenaria mercenaria TaxID=6596 RepID=UPI00234EDB56|nr:putative leucine-rich repeat-containing protein DDB_G0290503 [Mercenaria mercenaria]XP_053391060.1 putative leucine-rich repeat-containing protein DDB_G0290503 [Mercenaria mercenaria]